MTMQSTDAGLRKYYLIDKVILNENSEFDFDIYGTNEQEIPVSLLHERGVRLFKDDVQLLIEQTYLYVNEQQKRFYEEYYTNYMSERVIPTAMEVFYDDVAESINKLFNNPHSIKNMKEVENVVEDLVTTILKDDFTVSSFVSILSNHYHTHTHSLNVSVYAVCLGRHMGMAKDRLEDLATAALLHDLGKSKISNAILLKEAALTPKEFEEIKKHPLYGWALIKRLGVYQQHILDGVKYHHEKIDGTGYPDGLKGDNIPAFARIIAVCDVFDAVTTKRSYKDSISTFETLLSMKKEMRSHLDGMIVDHFIQIFREENDI